MARRYVLGLGVLVLAVTRNVMPSWSAWWHMMRVDQAVGWLHGSGTNVSDPRSNVSERFLQRLYLSDLSCSGIVHEVVKIPWASDWWNRWISSSPEPVSELYHSVRDARSVEDPRIQSILKNGFRSGYGGNKGTGVYLSSHSRYAWNWSASPIVLVCHIDPRRLTPSVLRRYRSEIKSGEREHNGWEYVVTDPQHIQVRYILRYSVDCRHDFIRENNASIGWVDHDKSGCPQCAPKNKRCDCALHPIIDPADLAMRVDEKNSVL